MTGNKIIIENLKGVKKLVFEFPFTGVHVISAANGSGKTTLLVCLERIINTRALNENFKQHEAINVDSYEDAKITYENSSNQTVTYTYRESSDSWRASTRRANPLAGIYNSIQFMPTLGQRVYVPNRQASRGGVLSAADSSFREAMTEVLEDQKFMGLLKANIGETRGRRGVNRRENTAYRLPLGRRQIRGVRQQYYYSESSFSLGEIFVLNLLYRIRNIEQGSLLLVDELEVALHPRVQYKLLRYLERIAIQRNLTVLVSTHSSSLIKCAKNLIYLERNQQGVVDVHYNCYSTYALRDVAIAEDIMPDFVFYVEDKMAEILLRLKLKKFFSLESRRTQALWKVLPIGGYAQVLNFGKKSKDYLLPNTVGQFLFLDSDVQDEKNRLRIKGNSRTEAEQALWELFNELHSQTKYLEITPELGLWRWIESNQTILNEYIAQNFEDRVIDFNRIFRDCNNAFPSTPTNEREMAKNKIKWIGENLSTQLGIDEDRTYVELFKVYVDNHYLVQENINNLRAQLGPIFNRRRIN